MHCVVQISLSLHYKNGFKSKKGNTMIRVTIILRTTKTEGTVKLRFRLREGRGVDLYHKSEIRADIRDLNKFDEYGNLKPKVSLFNKELKIAIIHEMDAMNLAYSSLCERMQKENINGEMFEAAISAILNPETQGLKKAKMTLLERFDKFIKDGFRDDIFGEGRMRHYNVVKGDLERFLMIKNLKSISHVEFTPDLLMDFREFIMNEYKYVEKYSFLYQDKIERDIPRKVRSDNTVVTKLKKLQAFYNELEDKEEVLKSPFRKLGKNRKASVLKERYDKPVFLLADELQKVRDKEVPEGMLETKECFLLQCALGCRIGDYQSLNMDKVVVSENGIPYVHYLASKTERENENFEEIITPIMLDTLELIKKWQFKFPILKYPTGKSGYNTKIKQLLEYCEIDRKCEVYSKELGDNEYIPLYILASSKICRKTNVDMMNKVQVNMYAAGLHKVGSKAVERYTMLELEDQFKLMCAAFGQPIYKVDKELNVIPDSTAHK